MFSKFILIAFWAFSLSGALWAFESPQSDAVGAIRDAETSTWPTLSPKHYDLAVVCSNHEDYTYETFVHDIGSANGSRLFSKVVDGAQFTPDEIPQSSNMIFIRIDSQSQLMANARDCLEQFPIPPSDASKSLGSNKLAPIAKVLPVQRKGEWQETVFNLNGNGQVEATFTYINPSENTEEIRNGIRASLLSLGTNAVDFDF